MNGNVKERIEHARELLGKLQGGMPNPAPPYYRTLLALLGDLISMIEAKAGGATVSPPTDPDDERIVDDLVARRTAGLRVTPMAKSEPAAPQPESSGGGEGDELSPCVREEYERCGEVSHDEAADIAQRYIDKAFNNKDKPRPLHCIPANPRTDSDIRLHAYIEQRRAKEAELKEKLAAAETLNGLVTEQCNYEKRRAEKAEAERDELRAKVEAWEPVVLVVGENRGNMSPYRIHRAWDQLPTEHRPEAKP